jgi:prevent-host-death family protein
VLWHDESGADSGDRYAPVSRSGDHFARAARSAGTAGTNSLDAAAVGPAGSQQLNLAEAKAKLSHLVDQAARGKSVIIAKSGIPMAKLVPLEDEETQAFKFGTLKDVLTDELVKAIGAPLPDDLLDAMMKESTDRGAGK